jgi:hypothetical protein
VVVVDNGRVRTRLLSPREAARLMGAPDTFQLPENYTHAYEAMGDAVVAPVVRWLSENLLEPMARLAQDKAPGKASAQTQRLMRSAEKRASEWKLDQKRMARKELVDRCMAILRAWRHESEGRPLACAGIIVSELGKRKWPLVPHDLAGKSGRLRIVLARFGEERPYAGEIDETAAADLAARLNAVTGYADSSAEEKAAVAEAIQRWLYVTIIKPQLDAESR